MQVNWDSQGKKLLKLAFKRLSRYLTTFWNSRLLEFLDSHWNWEEKHPLQVHQIHRWLRPQTQQVTLEFHSTAGCEVQQCLISPDTVLRRWGQAVPLRNWRHVRFDSICLNHLFRKQLELASVCVAHIPDIKLELTSPGPWITLGYTAINSALQLSK